MSEASVAQQPNGAEPRVAKASERTVPATSTPEKQKSPEKYKKSETLTKAWGNVVEAKAEAKHIPSSEVQTVGVYTAGDLAMPDFDGLAKMSVYERYVKPRELAMQRTIQKGEAVPQAFSVDRLYRDELDKHHADQVVQEMRKWINEENARRLADNEEGKPFKRPIKIGIYGGGIAWVGDTNTKTEKPKAIGLLAGISKEMSADMSPEKMAEAGNVGAIDFMRDAGYDICFTIDPKKPQGEMVSSLRADAVVRTAIVQGLTQGEYRINPSDGRTSYINEVDWSNGAFKKAELFQQAASTIAEVIKKIDPEDGKKLQEHVVALTLATASDREEIIDNIKEMFQRYEHPETTHLTGNQRRDKAFDSTSDALDFLINQNGIDTFLGGAPAEAKDLAAPIHREAFNRAPTVGDKIKHTLTEGLRMIANKAVQSIGKNVDAQNLVDTFQKSKIHVLQQTAGWFFSRTMEMGRANGLSEAEMESFRNNALLKAVIETLLGNARIVTLHDTSGQTVASDGAQIAERLLATYGDKITIAVDTLRRDTQITALDKAFIGMGNATKLPQHAEIKQGGLPAMQGFADSDREIKKATRDAIDTSEMSNGSGDRWIRVNPVNVIENLPSGAVLHEPYDQYLRRIKAT